jgi:phosphoglycolate phosphatase-like HAD superfamily hydrolase
VDDSRPHMAKITTLFIDKGGVLIDNTVLGPQYRHLLGEFLPTELGGPSEAWANANVGAGQRAFERYRQASLSAPASNIRDWYAEDVRRWLYEMCDEVGRPRPPASQADRIANAAHEYVRRRVDIRTPRIVERLQDFHGRGLKLHIASGDQHSDLLGYLATMGTLDLFNRVYGSDVIDVWKSSAAYYRAILADTETEAANAVVIDDSPRAIEWAGECDVRGVLVQRRDGEAFEDAVLRAFDEVNVLL